MILESFFSHSSYPIISRQFLSVPFRGGLFRQDNGLQDDLICAEGIQVGLKRNFAARNVAVARHFGGNQGITNIGDLGEPKLCTV
jgi:hypothetical protein